MIDFKKIFVEETLSESKKMTRNDAIQLTEILNAYFITLPPNEFNQTYNAKLHETGIKVQVYITRSDGNITKPCGYIELKNGAFISHYNCSRNISDEIETIINKIEKK